MTESEGCDEIQSLCVNCRQDGVTKLLVTMIPHFREVIIMSFHCDHCGFSNNELQSASTIQDKGVRYEVKCDNSEDLNRQVVKSDYACIKIPELEFEISRQPGLVTTVEGLIDRAIEGLTHSIQKNIDQVELVLKLTDFVANLRRLKSSIPFTLVIIDPSGNTYVENPQAPVVDPKMQITHFKRSPEENKLLGIFEEEEEVEVEEPSNPIPEDLRNEIMQFRTNCYSCSGPCFTNMKLTSIPHFKDIVLMATNCDSCGYKTTEIKSGAGIEEKGVKIVLPIKNDEDLKRDLVRSETCCLLIPELELDFGIAHSGRYTTVEGLLECIKDDLRTNPFIIGDSSSEERKAKIKATIDKLSHPIGLTIILDDPCGNSFIHDATDVTHYERTELQNDELGLSDMKTDL